MDLETIWKLQRENKKPIKKIKMTDECYAMLEILLGEMNTTKTLGPVGKLGMIPIEIDNELKKWSKSFEVIYGG